MRNTSGLLRSALFASIAVSIAGCSGMMSGDPFKEEVAEGKSESLSYSLSRRIVTGFGGVSKDTQKNIDYKPRAPLAVPPAMVLKEPESKDQATVEMANWPQQRDQAEDYLAQRNEAKSYGEKTRDDWENPVLPSREVAGFRVIGGGQNAEPTDNGKNDEAPEVTKEEREKFAEDMDRLKTAQADGVSKRQYLTEPPALYRTPASGASLPSSVKLDPTDKHDDWENPTGY